MEYLQRDTTGPWLVFSSKGLVFGNQVGTKLLEWQCCFNISCPKKMGNRSFTFHFWPKYFLHLHWTYLTMQRIRLLSKAIQWSNVCCQRVHEKVISSPPLLFHCQAESCHKYSHLSSRISIYPGITHFLSLAICFCYLCQENSIYTTAASCLQKFNSCDIVPLVLHAFSP